MDDADYNDQMNPQAAPLDAEAGDAGEGAVSKRQPLTWWERELFDWLQTIVTSLVLVSLVFAFAARIIGVLGPSMQDTLVTGQKVLISDLFYTPKCGDIVVFNMKDIHKYVTNLGMGEDDEPLVKRVIATGGQTVDIDFTTGEVRVDGALLVEPYIRELTMTSSPPGEMTYHRVVSEGMVFVMGDNRNHSTDSRSFGSVDARYILGRVLWRVWPLDEFGTVDSGRTSS